MSQMLWGSWLIRLKLRNACFPRELSLLSQFCFTSLLIFLLTVLNDKSKKKYMTILRIVKSDVLKNKTKTVIYLYAVT